MRHLTTNPRHSFRCYHKELLKRHMHVIEELKTITNGCSRC
jgi:hypothetical protein